MTLNVRSKCLSVLEPFLVQPEDYRKVAEGGSLLALFDSLSLVNLIVELENAFFIEIDTEDLEEVFSTLDSLTVYIEGKVGN
jgi:acyl carrier protein